MTTHADASFAAPDAVSAVTPDAAARDRALLLSALVVGVAGDLLLRGGEPRFGLLLWSLVLAAMALVVRGAGLPRDERTLVLLGPVLAAAGLVWRDAEVLLSIDTMSFLCSGALAVWVGSGRRLRELTVLDVIRTAVLAMLTAAFGGFSALRRSADRGANDGGAGTTRVWHLVGGAVLALPPLLIVAALLGSADAVFERVLGRMTDLLSEDGLEHAFLILLLSWLGLGWLAGTRDDRTGIRVVEPRSPGIPWVSASVGLYGLVGLLTLFVATQLRVLFGGEAYLQATLGLTRAMYAREGFFQMVAAAGIVLATLVIAEWLLTKEESAQRRYRTAGRLLIGLVVMMLGSAVARLWMYVSEFGLTIDRLVAFAVMCWVLVALATFGLTVLNGRAARFAPVMLAATVVWVAVLNAMNPEGMVVRANVARAEAGKPFDAVYHANLSADAVPILLASAPRLTALECAAVGAALRLRWAPTPAPIPDWRSGSLARARVQAWVADGALLPCAGGG